MSWQDILKENYIDDDLSVADVKDFIRRFRLERLPKLNGELEKEAHQWLGWLESGLKAMQTEEGNWQAFTNEYIVAKLQDIMDKAGFSVQDSVKGME